MTRRATIRTTHADPETVAAALAPDNTDEMATRVERVANGDGRDGADRATDDESGDAVTRRVVTEIERESTSGLQATVDDTLVNLAVADEVAAHARSGDAVQGRNGTAMTDDARPTEDASTDDRQQTDTNDTS